MYFWNYLTKPVWNNALSYKERLNFNPNPKLFIPEIKNIGQITQQKLDKYLQIWDKIVFEEVFDNRFFPKKWLKYYLEWFIWKTKIYIFDNHNVAFYFIGKFFLETNKKLNLIHIDQHSDMREPKFIPTKLNTLEDIEKYTFEWTNVGNYLIPLKKLWFIENIFQARSEYSVLEITNNLVKNQILNIDLDFWESNMATSIKSLNKVKNLIKEASLVLIATSPYFIDQNLAIKLAKQLLS